MFKILLLLGVIFYVVYRFGRKIYQIARFVAGVGDTIAQKQSQQTPPAQPKYQDKENNINVYDSKTKKKGDFSDGEYVDYEDVK